MSPTAVTQHKVIIREAECIVVKKGSSEQRAKAFAEMRARNSTMGKLADEILDHMPLRSDNVALIHITWNQQPNDTDRTLEWPWPLDAIDLLKEETVGKHKKGGADWIDYSFNVKASFAFALLSSRLPEGSVLDLSVSDGKDRPCD